PARPGGSALRRRRAGEHVPAHRIVNAKGILSGAEAFETPETQKQLLEAEGVPVRKTDAGWKVDLKEYGWDNSLEEAEELYRIFQEKGI
ncbi:MAG: MGMT family protein, partial [Schaedlerella sp.]|uniref:MGMT family protein n=1 Tax=Schaedlerella sp. TaxID=2676057 RepID=UPI003529471E